MKPDYDTSIVEHVSKDETEIEEELEKDEKYDMAVDIVIQTGQASISMIQRKLRVGYNRAARMNRDNGKGRDCRSVRRS